MATIQINISVIVDSEAHPQNILYALSEAGRLAGAYIIDNGIPPAGVDFDLGLVHATAAQGPATMFRPFRPK